MKEATASGNQIPSSSRPRKREIPGCSRGKKDLIIFPLHAKANSPLPVWKSFLERKKKGKKVFPCCGSISRWRKSKGRFIDNRRPPRSLQVNSSRDWTRRQFTRTKRTLSIHANSPKTCLPTCRYRGDIERTRPIDREENWKRALLLSPPSPPSFQFINFLFFSHYLQKTVKIPSLCATHTQQGLQESQRIQPIIVDREKTKSSPPP